MAAPKNFLDFVTFTRASTAMRVGPNGLFQSVAANRPRAEYDPATRALCGISIEPAATNLMPDSADFSGWATIRASVQTNAALSPDGTMNADKLVENTDAGVSHFILLGFSKAAAALDYTYSIMLKAGERSKMAIALRDDTFSGAVSGIIDLVAGTIGAPFVTGSGTPISNHITPMGDGWFLVDLIMTTNTATTIRAELFLADGGGNLDYNGDGTSGAFMFGGQLEQSRYRTGYIPTSGGAAGRAEDAALISGANFSDWYSPSAGTLLMDVEATYAQNGPGFSVIAAIENASDSQDIILVNIDEPTNQLRAALFSGGAVQAAPTLITGLTGSYSGKVAFAWAANDFAAIATGGVLQTDTSGTVTPGSPRTRMGLGLSPSAIGGSVRRPVLIRHLEYRPERMSNEEMAAWITG